MFCVFQSRQHVNVSTFEVFGKPPEHFALTDDLATQFDGDTTRPQSCFTFDDQPCFFVACWW